MTYKLRMTDATPLRQARQKRKLSLQVIADELGVTVGQMSRIERFGTKSLPHAMHLAEKFRLKITDLAPRDAA
jgi:transcriptional regulator with XRE-family HTH domain